MIVQATKNKTRLAFIIVIAMIVTTALISLSTGSSSINITRLVPTLMGNGTFQDEFVFYSLRLPRIIITFLCGVALATSGAILQGITKNDLADPGIVGINSGAGVAVTLFFLFIPANAETFAYLLPLAAFGGAMLTALTIYAFSYNKEQGLMPTQFILTGVGFSLALSGLMIVLISSSDRQQVEFIATWLAGGVWGTDWPFILALLPWLVILLPIVLYFAKHLNILRLGSPVATGTGVHVKRTRIVLLTMATALAASAVSVSGGIAFIGLMAPHLARAIVGNKHQRMLPFAMLIGGMLLLIADTIGRNIVPPAGIPAGIIAACIGAPYFLYLLSRK
ncbi:iron ABC transporter permease [Paenalkalicoccus suaedae]|uniref:Iron ABC transporter permease n=1 Tax=Paenalkalicoccus suaedae TaxID=2592382 RepID=A0A859FEF5_9BACI|nr:iron ABC transporter permease [Paenalkalicoccus suaedae]QKS70606.1 iron ABC transporter permease [Paenalkalicoccus suaedae]